MQNGTINMNKARRIDNGAYAAFVRKHSELVEEVKVMQIDDNERLYGIYLTDGGAVEFTKKGKIFIDMNTEKPMGLKKHTLINAIRYAAQEE